MKILIDARLYGLENAGLGRYAINLIDQLSRIDRKNKYVVLLRKKYFEMLKLPKNWRKVLADIPHYSLREQTLLPRIIEKINPDLVHFLHFNVPLVLNRRYVVTIHDLLMHKNKGLEATTLTPPLYFLKRLGYKTIFRKAVLGANQIIVPSKAIKNEVVDYYKIDKDKVNVIYEGFDERIGQSGRSIIEGPYFVYAGNAYPHKNLKRLVEAVLFLNKNSDQKVILAISSARNIFTQRLQKLVDKLHAAKFVKLLGFVPDKDLGSLYKNSTGFVFPSLSEGFGLPGLEAISSGTLLLASDIPVFKEIYADAAFYFNPLEISSVVEAMQKVLRMSKAEREKRITFGREFAKKYSWAKMAKETLEVYRDVGGR